MWFNYIRTSLRGICEQNVAPFFHLTRSTRAISSTPVFNASSIAEASQKKAAEEKSSRSRNHTVSPPELKDADIKPPKLPKHAPFINFYVTERSNTQESKVSMKAVTEKWNALSEEEKQSYHAKASELNEKAKEKLQRWLHSLKPGALRAINKGRTAVGQRPIRHNRYYGGLKRPTNGWMRFLVEYRAQHPDLSQQGVAAFIKRASLAWHELPEDRRKAYNDAFQADLKVWRKQYDEFKARLLAG